MNNMTSIPPPPIPTPAGDRAATLVQAKPVSGFFRPTVWLSGRLNFSRKYLLIGGVVLIALLSLSIPLLLQAREDSRVSQMEREGLKTYVRQTSVLAAMINLRGQALSRGRPPVDIPHSLTGGISEVVTQARRDGLAEQAERLSKSWLQVQNLTADDDPQRRFAALTASVNAMLGLIRDSSRSYRLDIDPELDATFDMLANRLPLLLETLAKQQDALALNSGEMTSYALGAQVVVSESVPALKSGIAQLVTAEPSSQRLQGDLAHLLERIAQQQDAADKILTDPAATGELRALSFNNQDTAHRLLDDSTAAADAYLGARIERLNRWQWVVATLLVGSIAAIAYLFAGIYLSTLRSLKSLSNGTDAFCEGRLDARIEIGTQDELVVVARNFNTMAEKFSGLLDMVRKQNESRQRELETMVRLRTNELAEKNEQLRAAGERVQEELTLARDMQRAILPQHFPADKRWSVHACMFPARELGGDFYDCFPLPDGRYGVLVADVSGKGVGAAFFMAVSRTVLLDVATSGETPAGVFAKANNILCERNPMELFVTACYAIYDPANGHLVYAGAGHHPPLRRRATGRIESLPCVKDIALGVMPDMTYTNAETVLEPGSRLVLYTDGITEALSLRGETYNETRLRNWLAAVPDEMDAAALVDSLVKDVADFVDGAEASDDLTCLVLCRE